jgi:lactate 2-monooxygenase
MLISSSDTFSLGWRPKDLDRSYLPFIYGQGCQIGLSDPVFNAKYAQIQSQRRMIPIWERIKETLSVLLRPRSLWGILRIFWYASLIRKSQAWLDVINSGTYRSWEDLALLRRHWSGPIVLKGIQTVEDAHRAIDAGLDGIVVSNHGGRQLDGAMASLDALAAIASDKRVAESSLTLLFDSGIRTGTDIIKALALGAHAILIGRPYIYGLAIAGQRGVEHVLRCLLADFDNSLGLMGKTSISELGRGDLEIVP